MGKVESECESTHDKLDSPSGEGLKKIGPIRSVRNFKKSSGFGSVRKFKNDTSPSSSISCNKSLLTVFQAAPLVFHDDNENIHPVDLLDFESEKRKLTESTSNGNLKIDVAYDIANTERLQLFLTKGEGRALHFSCHGHPDYLAIEDGWGAMHPLPVKNLKEWINAGGNNLLFVFVSACHSRSAGEAFLKAGVKHVVCCQQDSQPIRNEVAVYFSKSFYQALAHGKSLEKAFELARQAVKNHSELHPSVRQSEVEKFALLPEWGDHNISIFKSSRKKDDIDSMNNKSLENNEKKAKEVVTNRNQILPVPPRIFEGRQVDMYHILQSLKVSRLVRVTGSEAGIGRSCVVQAVCQYIQKRKCTFSLEFSEILWLPYMLEQVREKLSSVTKSTNVLSHSRRAQMVEEEYQRQFLQYSNQDDHKLLVVDTRQSLYNGSFKKTISFIDKIIQTTQNRIIMIHNENDQDDLIRHIQYVERDVIIKNLDFISTVRLFGKLCQHVTNRQHASISNHLQFSSLLIAEGVNSSEVCKSYRGRTLFKMLGEGIPAKIHYAAKNMTVEKYNEVILLALRKNHNLHFESRVDLEIKASSLSLELSKATEENRFLDAQDYQNQIDEIKILRDSFPDYYSLLSLANSIQTDKELAVKEKNFLEAHQFQEQYDSLQEKIKIEGNALKNLGKELLNLKIGENPGEQRNIREGESIGEINGNYLSKLGAMNKIEKHLLQTFDMAVFLVENEGKNYVWVSTSTKYAESAGALAGSIAGASAGSVLGPLGVVSGAVAGAVVGSVSSRNIAEKGSDLVSSGKEARGATPDESYKFGDFTRGILSSGKEARGATASEGYKFGDFTRGLLKRKKKNRK